MPKFKGRKVRKTSAVRNKANPSMGSSRRKLTPRGSSKRTSTRGRTY